MKLLITGAYGQLGSELKILSNNYPGWDFLFTDVDTLNITDGNAVIKYFQEKVPNYVINCAAII